MATKASKEILTTEQKLDAALKALIDKIDEAEKKLGKGKAVSAEPAPISKPAPAPTTQQQPVAKPTTPTPTTTTSANVSSPNLTSSNKKPKVLVIVTNNSQSPLPDKTGVYAPELFHIWHALENDYEVVLASPKGGKAPIDEGSIKAYGKDPICASYLNDSSKMQLLEHTKSLSVVQYEKGFVGIVLTGGYGVMWDFPTAELGKLVATFWEAGNAVAAVCHGPAGFIHATLSNGKPLVAGKKVTSFSNSEELEISKAYGNLDLKKAMGFFIEDKFKEQGAQFSAGKIWTEHVVVDGRLITGQNPQSSLKVGQELVKVLQGSHGAPGATKAVTPIDDATSKIAERLLEQVEKKTGRKYQTWHPKEYMTQVVNGTNYFIKVSVDNGAFIHVRANLDLTKRLTLHSIREFANEQPLAYF